MQQHAFASEVRIANEDVQRMRKAFGGMYVDRRREERYPVHLESGYALCTDGKRLHTIPVNYPSASGINLLLSQLREGWCDEQGMAVKPFVGAEAFWHWREIVPKVDTGYLCDVEEWLPALASVRGWGWSVFSFQEDGTVVMPAKDDADKFKVKLSHHMYKGRDNLRVYRRVYNPQYIYDVFHSAAELGDTKVFMCFVSGYETAPLLCRGNISSLLALVLGRK